MTENQSLDHNGPDWPRESLSSLLLLAAKKGKSGAVRALLKSRADHSVQDCDGNTPLLHSVSKGDNQSVSLLLRSGASLKETNKFGEGILHAAFSNGHFHLGKNLIEQGASQDTLNLNGLDWKAFSVQAGQDMEAVQAALDLDLQVAFLEMKSANQSILNTTFQPKQKKDSTASAYLRELAIGIFPQHAVARQSQKYSISQVPAPTGRIVTCPPISYCGESARAPDRFIEGFDGGVFDSGCALDTKISDTSTRTGSGAVEVVRTVEGSEICASENYLAGPRNTAPESSRLCFGAGSASSSFTAPPSLMNHGGLGDKLAVDDSTDLDAFEVLYLSQGDRKLNALDALHDDNPLQPNAEADGLPEIIAAAKDLGIAVDEPGRGFTDLLAEAEAFYAEMGHQSITEQRDALHEFMDRAHATVLPTLPLLEISDPLRLALADRSALFDGARRLSLEAAPWRILRGFAVIVVNTWGKNGGSLGMACQYALDAERMAHFLDRVGFSEVQVLRDLTRQQLLEYMDQLSIALQPGGNLDEHDGLFIYLAGSGGAFTFDCAPDPGKVSQLLQDRPVHVEEILERLRGALMGRPKILFAQICCDPQERANANVQHTVEPVCCQPSMYEDLLDDSPEVMITWCSTRGHVHWVPRGGSLVTNFLMEELSSHGRDLDFISIVDSTSRKLIDHFNERQGLGGADCLVGKKAYDDFFVQKLVVFKNSKMPAVTLGPSMVFCQDYVAPQFSLSMTDSCLSKLEPNANNFPVHAMAQLPISYATCRENVAWEFLIHDLNGSDDLVVGVVQNRDQLFQKLDPAKISYHDVSPSSTSPPGQVRRNRRNSLVDDDNIPHIPRPGVDIGWGISATGILYPGQRVHNHGFGTKDTVECWIDKSNKTIEFTVNHKHVGHIFQDSSPSEILPVVVNTFVLWIAFFVVQAGPSHSWFSAECRALLLLQCGARTALDLVAPVSPGQSLAEVCK